MHVIWQTFTHNYMQSVLWNMDIATFWTLKESRHRINQPVMTIQNWDNKKFWC